MPSVRSPAPGGLQLCHPLDSACIEGRALLFAWDAQDLPEAKVFRLTVKPRGLLQTAEAALAENEAAFEATVEHVQFLAFDLQRLDPRASSFVWKVAAHDGTGDGAKELASTPAATFRTRPVHSILAGLSLEEGRPAQQQPAAVSAERRVGGGPAQCPNGDLENGDFQGWTGYYGSRANSPMVNLNLMQPGIVNGRHTIQTQGFDAQVGGTLLPRVAEGDHSARLGRPQGSSDADILAYTFTVTTANQWFGFRYALAMQRCPNVSSSDLQPRFYYYVLPGSSIFFGMNNIPVATGGTDADDSSLSSTLGGTRYRGWTPVCLDLRPHLGKTMTIVFITAGCSLGGHFGYAYIDSLCATNLATPSFTLPDRACGGDSPIVADGSASVGETSHLWSIAESDAQGNPDPATEVYQWWSGPAGTLDLGAFCIAKTGHPLKCGTYYRVKLAVANNCTPWSEKTRLVYVACPPVTAGPDLCVKCGPDGTSTQLGVGNPATPGTTYVWSPALGLDDPNSPSPRHANGSVPYPITYVVTARDASGCTATDSVTIYCKAPELGLAVRPGCCSTTLVATAAGAQSIKWSNGAVGVPSIQVGSGTYTATATNPCGSVSKSVAVTASAGFTGPRHPVAGTSKFRPGQGIPGIPYSDRLRIKDVVAGNPAGVYGTPNSYNATGYVLEIFNRWGSLIKTVAADNCQGFPNWSVSWDGTDQSGALVPQDVYVWKLSMKNCDHSLRPATIRKFADRYCVEWFTLFGVRLWCKRHNVPAGTTVDDPSGVGSVTVVY